MCVVLVLSAALLVAEHAVAVFFAISGVAAVWCVWSLVAQFSTGGLYETDSDLAGRGWLPFGYRRQPWGDIERFADVRKQVWAIRRDGSIWRVNGMVQGARIQWDDGESCEIVGVLNDRLAAWRSSHANDDTATDRPLLDG